MPHNPHANFSPTLEGYSGQTPFRYWCQMALPLTYDDSLSYYELLNKVVSYVNNTIEDVANVETNVGRLSDAYNQLQNYVNDYFDNIDIEQELRTVLDRMALDGSLDEILAPIVALQLPDVVSEQIDDAVSEQIDDSVAGQIGNTVSNQLPAIASEQIPDEVSDWLTAHVNPVGSAVVVDDTLSISGAAADSKTTGEKISSLKNALEGANNIKKEYGDIIDAMDAAGNSDIISFSADILPNQSGSGTPSSENPRPFTARTNITLAITPKNLLRQRTGSITTSGVTVTPNSDGTFTFTGTGNNGGPVMGYVYLKAGVKYYAEGLYDGTNYYPRLDPPSGNNGHRIFPGSGSTFTANETGSWTVREYVKSGVSFNKSNAIIMVCLANSSHSKTPSLGKIATIPFDESITDCYAGVYEYNKGVVSLGIYPHYSSYDGEPLSGKWVSSMDEYSPNNVPTTGAEVIDMSGTISRTYTFSVSEELKCYDGETVFSSNFTSSILRHLTYLANEELSLNNHYDIPTYYRLNNYISEKLTTIRNAILDSGGNYDSFIWITDCHWTLNAKNSPKLIKYITDRIPIPRVFFGGDMGEGINLTVLNAYKEKIKSKIYNTIGNHEYHNRYYDIDYPYISLDIKDAYLWEFFNSGMVDAVIGNAERNYYYVDNPVQKMRYIVLNVYGENTVETFESEQQEWLANTALNLPAEYTAIIICHQVAYVNHNTGELSFEYGAGGTAIKNIVDSSNAKIACILCGHTHFDGMGYTDNGVPVIVSTCDKYLASPGYDEWITNYRTRYTLTEQAFDVVIIDKKNEKITAVRIGCPANNPTGDPLEKRTANY